MSRPGFDQMDVPKNRKAQLQAASSIYKLHKPNSKVPTLWHYLEAIVIDKDPMALAAMEKVMRMDEEEPGNVKQHFKRHK